MQPSDTPESLPEASSAPCLVAPSPWVCKGEIFWFFDYSRGKSYPDSAQFGDLEANSPWADPKATGEYRGGLRHVQVVRYKDTPVGPYDELIWSPGMFEVPATGGVSQRITRIYVSSTESVYNGRKNWNIPKHLAHFTFTPTNPSSPSVLPYSRITVASPSTPDRPFFAVDLTPTMFFGTASIPFDSAILPMNQTLAHPPLPASLRAREDALVGTDRWCVMPILMKGKAGFLRCKGGLEGGKFGDDDGFPDVQPWSLGMWLRDFELRFPVGEHPEKKDD